MAYLSDAKASKELLDVGADWPNPAPKYALAWLPLSTFKPWQLKAKEPEKLKLEADE